MLESSRQIDALAGGQLQLGSQRTVRPLADVPTGAAVQVGGTLRLSGDTVSLADAQITGAAFLSAKGALSLLGSNAFKASLDVSAQNVTANSLSVGSNAAFKVVDQLAIAKLTGSLADLSAAGVALGSLSLSDSLKGTTTHDFTAESLSAAKSISLNVGGALQAKRVDAPMASISAGRQVSLDLLKTETASLRSATQIALADAQGASFTLQAPQIQAALKYASTAAVPGDTLSTTLTGIDGAAAQQISLVVSPPQRWLIPVLNTRNASLTTSGRTTQFDQARIGDTFTLTTPDGLIGLTSATVQVLPKVDVQLYAPSGEFMLLRDRQYAYTTAMALVYKPSQIVSAPNTSTAPPEAAASAANASTTRSVPTVPMSGVAGLAGLAAGFAQMPVTNPIEPGREQDGDLVGELEF